MYIDTTYLVPVSRFHIYVYSHQSTIILYYVSASSNLQMNRKDVEMKKLVQDLK